MNIRDTISALDNLAECARNDPGCEADDLYEAEFLLASCTPELSPAAFMAMMARFVRARNR